MLTKIAKWLEGGEPRFNDRDPDAFERLVGIATGGQGRTGVTTTDQGTPR